MSTFRDGQVVTWHYESNQGWGIDALISNCIVRKVTAKRVQIEVPLRKGGTVLRWVTPAKLIAHK